MNALNTALTTFFDWILSPLEVLGQGFALIVVSAVFGVLALIAFKHISWQKGIGLTKDRIKGHMIAIRIYQDDLAIVGKSILKVLGRNLQYLALNFGPFIPLAIPFVFVVAQMVVRYGFEPVPVQAKPSVLLAGQGTTLRVEMAPGRFEDVAGLEVELPEGLVALSRPVRVPARGLAFVEVAAVRPGSYAIGFRLGDGTIETKRLVAGEQAERWMQPERVRSPWLAMLWPSEPALPSDSPFARIAFQYPESDLGWLPGGPMGVLVVFILASMAFGFLMLKPLGVQI